MPLMVLPGLRLSIQQLPIELGREQTLNLTSGSLYSTSTITYHLSITLLMVNHHKMGVTRINQKINLKCDYGNIQLLYTYCTMKIEHKARFKIKTMSIG
jgi:hypothetical protein